MPDTMRYPKDIWIWNRSHLGEFVYGTMYRNTQPKEWVFPMEQRFGFNTDPSVYLLLLTAPPEFLCKRDDGESFSANEMDKIAELRRFDIAFEESGIVNKLRLDVTNDGEYKSKDEIFNQVNKFIFG